VSEEHEVRFAEGSCPNKANLRQQATQVQVEEEVGAAAGCSTSSNKRSLCNLHPKEKKKEASAISDRPSSSFNTHSLFKQ